MYFAKLQQDASLIIAGKCPTILQDAYLAYEDTGFTLRSAPNGYLIFGGESHRTGVSADYNRYRRLADEAIKAFPGFKPEFYWSAQDCMPPDRLPYIGNYSRVTPNLYVASGFRKWGLTQSMAASIILTDMITGVKNEYADIYKPSRLPIPSSLPKRFSYLKDSAKGLIRGQAVNVEPDYEEPEKERGGVYNYNGKRAGVYKDKDGVLHGVIAVCSHLGCKLSWNGDDNTYDCPCHGSKFDIYGSNLENPALKPLQKIQIRGLG